MPSVSNTARIGPPAMMQGATFAQRHARQSALGGVGRLADRLRHFASLAVTEADAALLIADNDECGKAEPAAALHDFGDAVDMHELVDELAVALFASSLAGFTRHVGTPLFVQPSVRETIQPQNFNPLSRAASASALTRP